MEPRGAVIADLVAAHCVNHDVACAIVAEVARLRLRTLDNDDAADVRASAVAHAAQSLAMLDKLADALVVAGNEIDTLSDEAWKRRMELTRTMVAVIGARRVAARDVVVAVIPRDVRQSAQRLSDDEVAKRARAAQR